MQVSPEPDDPAELNPIFEQQYTAATPGSVLKILHESPIPVTVSERVLSSNDWCQLFEQSRDLPHSSLTPYAEMVTWRRRFYLALGAALIALLALMLVCASRP